MARNKPEEPTRGRCRETLYVAELVLERGDDP